MAKVGIVMGSDSDMPIMSKAADILEKLGIDYEIKIISAHREPDVFFEYAKTAEEKGFKVIIAGAGMAAHLPGDVYKRQVTGSQVLTKILRQSIHIWDLTVSIRLSMYVRREQRAFCTRKNIQSVQRRVSGQNH